MAAVIRLVTVVDIDDGPSRAPNRETPGSMSLSALHVAVLSDGYRLTLLDDRGWSESGPPDIWRRTSVDEVEATARAVVGPDEPFGSRSLADMEADHWADLARILGQQGVLLSADQLSRLPHEVELTARLRRRLADA